MDYQRVLEFVSLSFEIFPRELKKFENSLKLLGVLFSISLIIYNCSKFRKKYNAIIEEKNRELAQDKQIRIIPRINPHSFRHSQASLLFFSGKDSITISKRLGHAKVSTTTDIYSHLCKQTVSMTE